MDINIEANTMAAAQAEYGDDSNLDYEKSEMMEHSFAQRETSMLPVSFTDTKQGTSKIKIHFFPWNSHLL